MNPITVAVFLLSAAGLLFAGVLIVCRYGATAHHDRAFYSAVVGLITIPVWLISLARLASQLFWGTFLSPPGVVFIASSIALLLAVGVSIVSLARLRRAS